MGNTVGSSPWTDGYVIIEPDLDPNTGTIIKGSVFEAITKGRYVALTNNGLRHANFHDSSSMLIGIAIEDGIPNGEVRVQATGNYFDDNSYPVGTELFLQTDGIYNSFVSGRKIGRVITLKEVNLNVNDLSNLQAQPNFLPIHTHTVEQIVPAVFDCGIFL